MKKLFAILSLTLAAASTSCLEHDDPAEDVGLDTAPDDTAGEDSGAADADEVDFCETDPFYLYNFGPRPTPDELIPEEGTPCDCLGHRFDFFDEPPCDRGTATCTGGGLDSAAWRIDDGVCADDAGWDRDSDSDASE